MPHVLLMLASSALLAATPARPIVVVDLYTEPSLFHRRYQVYEAEVTYSDLSGYPTSDNASSVRVSPRGQQELKEAVAQLRSTPLAQSYAARGALDGFAIELDYLAADGRRRVRVSNCAVPQLLPLISFINRRVPASFAIPASTASCSTE
jgi:hypothetical protein